jgi:prepilin-type N-terminal cleavage/methylation domain-containing protein
MQLTVRRARGFSLAEIAVVMVIVGLLIGGLLAPLSAQMDQRSFTDTQKRIEYANELLLGFAIANGRLPCPASSSSNGDESPSGGGTCTNYYDGYLPAKALGMQPTDSSGYALDAFNNRIRYALSKTGTLLPSGSCTASPLPPFSSSINLKANGLQCVPADLLVCSSSQASGFSSTLCGTNNSLVNQNTVVAIVFSGGKNAATSDATRTDELANTDANATFVYHTPTPSGATGGEYDDQMVWISTGLLFGRMVSAGVLP